MEFILCRKLTDHRKELLSKDPGLRESLKIMLLFRKIMTWFLYCSRNQACGKFFRNCDISQFFHSASARYSFPGNDAWQKAFYADWCFLLTDTSMWCSELVLINSLRSACKDGTPGKNKQLSQEFILQNTMREICPGWRCWNQCPPV